MGLWFGEVGSTLVAGNPSGPTGSASYVWSQGVDIVVSGATGLDDQDSSQHDDAECVVTTTAVIKRTRRRRLDRIKTLTLSGKIRDHERASEDELFDLDMFPRPRTFGECMEFGNDPCPYVSCRHHMHGDVNELTGSYQMRGGTVEVSDAGSNCSIKIALDRGPMTLEEVGNEYGFTKERIRQVETAARWRFVEAGVSMLDLYLIQSARVDQ
jgi:hypothetical protein